MNWFFWLVGISWVLGLGFLLWVGIKYRNVPLVYKGVRKPHDWDMGTWADWIEKQESD